MRFPGNVVASDNVKARLISEADAIAPGQSVWVALELNIRDGWHTYWRNPGDSGQATKLTWTLPAGVTAGDILWTTPHRFEVAPLVNYGYAKHAMHLVQITAARGPQSRGCRSSLQRKASWLVCADVCIPESADLQLRLPRDGERRRRHRPGRRALVRGGPRAIFPSAAPAPTSAMIRDGQLILTLGTEWGEHAVPDQDRSRSSPMTKAVSSTPRRKR